MCVACLCMSDGICVRQLVPECLRLCLSTLFFTGTLATSCLSAVTQASDGTGEPGHAPAPAGGRGVVAHRTCPPTHGRQGQPQPRRLQLPGVERARRTAAARSATWHSRDAEEMKIPWKV